MATYCNYADVSRVIDCIDLGATEQAPNVVPVNFRTPFIPRTIASRKQQSGEKDGKKSPDVSKTCGYES